MRLIAIVLAVFSVLTLSGVSARADSKVLTNGDFEQGTEGEIPPGWSKTSWGPGKAVLIKFDTHSGRGALEVVNSGKTWQVAYQATAVGIHLSPSKT